MSISMPNNKEEKRERLNRLVNCGQISQKYADELYKTYLINTHQKMTGE